MSKPTKIAVVGSLNVDYFTRVERFPAPGETVMADGLEIRFGGKGANQAVAAARLGAQVEMIGCVGGDEMGRGYLERLREFGVGTAGLGVADAAATGSAFITLDRRAENSIIVAPGANFRFSIDQLEASARLIQDADCLILQNEIPGELNSAAMAIARASGTRIFYNPAPWREGVDFSKGSVDCLIVNETEAEFLLGSPVTSLRALADTPGIVVTRGAESTLAHLGTQLVEVSPPTVTPVDTVGAGDTFVAALAVFGGAGSEVSSEALRLANTAAALSTRRLGAQEAMPTIRELAEFEQETPDDPTAKDGGLRC